MIEQRCSEEIGLTKVLGEGVELGKERDALVTRLNDEQDRRQALELEVKALATEDNDFYRQAFTRLQQFLGSMNESALAAQTRSTATPHDDRLYAEITALNDRLDEAHHQSEVLSANTQYAVQRLGPRGARPPLPRCRVRQQPLDVPAESRPFRIPQPLPARQHEHRCDLEPAAAAPRVRPHLGRAAGWPLAQRDRQRVRLRDDAACWPKWPAP